MEEDRVRARLEQLHHDAIAAEMRGYDKMRDLYELEWARCFRELVAVRASVMQWCGDPLTAAESGPTYSATAALTPEELETVRTILERGRERMRLGRARRVSRASRQSEFSACGVCGRALLVAAPLWRYPHVLFCGGCEPLTRGESFGDRLRAE